MQITINRIKKIIRRNLKLIILIMIAFMVLEVLALISLNTVDRRFMRDLAVGLEKGWNLENNEMELQDKEENNETAFLNYEYDAISKYEGAKFRSKRLGELANRYIEVLRTSIEIANKYDVNKKFNAFWKEFSPYYGERTRILYELYKKGYRLQTTKKEYKEENNNIIAQGWALEKSETIDFKKIDDKKGNIVYRAEFENDSGFDLEYLNYDIQLLDKKGNIVEMVSAYASDIKAEDQINMEFYLVGENVVKYTVVSETCQIKKNEK